jgi:opacity protein-like surface antigen
MQRIRPVFARALVLGATATLALSVVPRTARAQGMASESPHMLRIGVAGGVVVPTSNTRDALKEGVQAHAFALVNLVQGFPFRFNLGYQKLNLKSIVASGTQQALTGDTKILSGTAGTQIDLLHGPLRPYLVAGVGGFNVTQSLEGASTASTSESQFKFGIDGGAGVALQLGRISAFVEGKIQNIYTEAGAIDAKSIKAVPVSFGILF